MKRKTKIGKDGHEEVRFRLITNDSNFNFTFIN